MLLKILGIIWFAISFIDLAFFIYIAIYSKQYIVENNIEVEANSLITRIFAFLRLIIISLLPIVNVFMLWSCLVGDIENEVVKQIEKKYKKE